MHRNPAMLYLFALNKSKIIQFYYSSPIIEIGIISKYVREQGCEKEYINLHKSTQLWLF